jgi:SAM-dependent methyltransferase
MPMNSFTEFDAFAYDYRRIHTANVRLSGVDSGYFCEHKILVLKAMEPDPRLHLLDFGCGDGALADFFLTHYPQGDYTGIDVSIQSIRVAQTRHPARCRFWHYNPPRAPLADGSVDAAIAANVFHHIARKDHEHHVREIMRMLAPGGRLYLFEHNPYNPATRYIVKTCVFDRNAALLRPGYARKLLAGCGLHVQGPAYLLFFPRNRLFQKVIRLEKHLKKIPAGAQYMLCGFKPDAGGREPGPPSVAGNERGCHAF